MNCVLCNNTNFKLAIDNITNPRAIGTATYQYQECTACHLWQLSPYPSQDELNEIYTHEYNLYQNDGNSLVEKILQKLSQSRLDTVSKYLLSNATILDVGCGTGTFLSQMQKKGFNVYGSEWSQSAANQAKNKIGESRVTVGDLDSVTITDVDAVTLWHVLEHNRNPSDLISKISQKLKSQGYLFIEVPNSQSITLHRTGNKYKWFSIPEHVTYWSEESLQTLARQSGFEVCATYTPFSMPFLYAKSHNTLFPKLLSPAIQAIGAYRQKGDILRHVWKKRE